MMDDPHFGFILAAYGAGMIVLASLLLWISLDYSKQRRLLNGFEASGTRRRSGGNDI
jgi:heme exporter protein CcmD